MSFGNVEPLHGRKLMRSRRIGNLQRAHILVARYDLFGGTRIGHKTPDITLWPVTDKMLFVPFECNV